jgi:wyosine [tRNA(Phe)-imidazoG37] synthetase (radical SAM superfamily)
MTMLLSPKPGIIYGPVASRRLGWSLGINLLPPRQKPCTLDCAYCQYGFTQRAPSPGDAFPTVAQVLAAVEAALLDRALRPAFLTFSGNGEPTTHPDFPAMVRGVRDLRDRLLPTARVAVLSNSTRVGQAEVRRALERCDLRIMKLDAGTEAMFRRYSRPMEPITLDDIVDGLRALPGVTLQSLFAGGAGGNADAEHVTAWIDRVVAVRPIDVQLYTLDRASPSSDLAPLDEPALTGIARALHRAGWPATVFPPCPRARATTGG